MRRSYLFNSLRPGDTIWRQRSGSTLVQVMACCLTAPSHYLNQCWLSISSVQWLSSNDNPTRDTSAINHYDPFENYISKISFKFPRGQWVNGNSHSWQYCLPVCGQTSVSWVPWCCHTGLTLAGLPYPCHTNLVPTQQADFPKPAELGAPYDQLSCQMWRTWNWPGWWFLVFLWQAHTLLV